MESQDATMDHFTVTESQLTRADVDSTTTNKVTGLMHAACFDYEACKLLIDKGANIYAVDVKGQTALHFAVINQQPSIARLLVEKGADPFHRDNNGDDPITIACCCRYEQTLNALLDAFLPRANEFQLQQIEKYRRLISYCKLRWNIKHRTDWCQPGKLQDAKRDIELGLDLTLEIFGLAHHRFYDAIHEAASCYFRAKFYDKWLCQLFQNFQTLFNPDLDCGTRYKELERLIKDMRESITRLAIDKMTDSKSSFAFDAFDELLRTVIEQAVNCSYPDESQVRVLILLLIRLALLDDCKNQWRQSFRNLVCRAVELRTRNGTRYKFLIAEMEECAYRLPLVRMTNVVTLLLECGANIEETDENGNSIAFYLDVWLGDYVNSGKQLAQTFVRHGIHLDARNPWGKENSAYMRKFGVEVEPSINLKCLAARAIRRFNIPFAGMIPATLMDFVKMH